MAHLRTLAILSVIACLAFFAVENTKPVDLIVAGHSDTWVDHYANITLNLVPRNNKIKLKQDSPLRLKITVSDNLSTAYPVITASKKNFVDNAASFNILVRGKKEGQGLVSVRVTYFLCSDVSCERFEDVIDHSIYVKKR